MVIYAGSFVAYAAQQGTRYAMVRGSDWTTACASASNYSCYVTQTNVSVLQNYVLSLPHPGLNLTTANISPTWLLTTASGATCVQYSQGCQVKVQVSYTFQLNIPFVPASIPLSSTSIETIQD